MNMRIKFFFPEENFDEISKPLPEMITRFANLAKKLGDEAVHEQDLSLVHSNRAKNLRAEADRARVAGVKLACISA